jgi:hypothetical protein
MFPSKLGFHPFPHEILSGAETFLAEPVGIGELKQTLEEHIRR